MDKTDQAGRPPANFQPIALGPDDWILTNNFRALVGRRFASWADAARAFRLQATHMSRYANGGRAPSNATLRRMLDAMDYEVHDLLHALPRRRCTAACPSQPPPHPQQHFHSCSLPAGHDGPHAFPCE